MADGTATIARLEAELATTPRATRPYEHALVAHRLGLAYAETPGADADDRLRRALACFDLASSLLEPAFHPLEHARVLTAAGSVRRSLGEPDAALRLFTSAAEIAATRVTADEAAAMVNNIGLALLGTGALDDAVERFSEAIELFDAAGAEGRRGRASALHNRGLARAASGAVSDLLRAVADYDEALATVAYDEASLHHGLVHHSRGVAAVALCERDAPPGAAHWRTTAIEVFGQALDIFVWPEHRVHHAIASFNLGRTWVGAGTDESLRRGVLHLEDAVTAFDPRSQSGPWRQAYDALLAAESELAQRHPGQRRPDHLVALLHDAGPDEAQRLLRRRLTRWFVLPAPARDSLLRDLVTAAVVAGEGSGTGALVLMLSSAVELPVEAQAAVLDAFLSVRRSLDDDGREVIDGLVDRAVGEAVVGPQRVFVRDHLVAGGFERP